MRLRYKILLAGSAIGLLIFLILPRPILVTTLVCGNQNCDYELQHHRTEWQVAGGLDVVCSVLEDGKDAFGKKGSRAISINPCIGNGGGGYDFRIPYVLGAILLAETIGLSLVFVYINARHKRIEKQR